MTVPPALDVLASDPPPARRALRSTALAALVGVAALAVAATGTVAVHYLSGGGPQPEDVLPSDVVAMAKVDLDPAASQKIAVYRLARKFPSQRSAKDADDLRQRLLRSLFDGSHIDYARDVEPWAGDRAAVALEPVPSAEAAPLFAVAYTDHDKARASLQRLAGSSGTAFAFSSHAHYVLLSPSRAAVDRAAAASHVLADSGSFSDDVRALDGDQVVTAWADLGATWSAVPQQARAAANLHPTGRVALGVHAMSDGIEVVGRGTGVSTGAATAPAARGTDLAQSFPADAVGVLSVAGLGTGLAQGLLSAEAGGDPLGLQAAASGVGLDVERDLPVLLGTETAVAVFDDQQGALRTRTPDPGAAKALLDKVAGLIPGESSGDVLPPDQFRTVDRGIVVGTSADVVAHVADGGGALGRSSGFRRAVPDAAGAAVVGYVDVRKALALAGSSSAKDPDVAPLDVVGLSVSGGSSTSFRLRVMVR